MIRSRLEEYVKWCESNGLTSFVVLYDVSYDGQEQHIEIDESGVTWYRYGEVIKEKWEGEQMTTLGINLYNFYKYKLSQIREKKLDKLGI